MVSFAVSIIQTEILILLDSNACQGLTDFNLPEICLNFEVTAYEIDLYQ